MGTKNVSVSWSKMPVGRGGVCVGGRWAVGERGSLKKNLRTENATREKGRKDDRLVDVK
jgi:hypothetical protein